MTSMMEECRNCEFVAAHRSGHYVCRFNPPTVTTELIHSGSNMVVARFPEVNSSDWCGKFQKAEALGDSVLIRHSRRLE